VWVFFVVVGVVADGVVMVTARFVDDDVDVGKVLGFWWF